MGGGAIRYRDVRTRDAPACMSVLPVAQSGSVGEQDHIYFPEWADRPTAVGRLFEADHNSYLAGGYSEEFGYDVRPDRPAIFPTIDGVPEQNQLWNVQIEGLHPGYPECAYPQDRDRPTSRDHTAHAPAGTLAADRHSREGVNRFTVIRVGEHGAGPSSRARLAARATAMWTRLRTLGAGLRSAIGGMPVVIEARETARRAAEYPQTNPRDRREL